MSGGIITGLYVPGDRPERFDKAIATGADLVIIDLEDAVAPANKSRARDAMEAWLNARDDVASPRIQVRVNAGDDDDLAAVRSLRAAVEIRLPKVESATDLDDVFERAGGLSITALIETAAGIENATAIAAHRAVAHVALGEADLATDLGSTDPAVIDYARMRVLYAARAARLPAPMLSAFTNIQDLEGLRADTQRGHDQGWVGRVAVHPGQLEVIARVFTATDVERAWAREVVDAVATGGVARLASGEMVDAAMLGRARALLEP